MPIRIWFQLKARPWLLLAAVFSFVPWILFAVHVPLSGGAPFGPDAARKIYYSIIDVFAPLFYLVDVPDGPMVILAEHTTGGYQFWSWTLFSVINYLFWCVVFASLAWVLRRLKHRTAQSRDAG